MTLKRFKLFFVILAVASLTCRANAKQLHSEVSLLVNASQASQLISSLKLRQSSRLDQYLDYFYEGKFQFLSNDSFHKLRLMTDDSKSIKLQESEFKSSKDHNCQDSSITVVTRSSAEIKASKDDLLQMSLSHRIILESLVNMDKDKLIEAEKILRSIYNDISYGSDYSNDTFVKYPGVLTASYSSAKTKYKRDLTLSNGQQLELSVTYARNYLSNEIFKNEISLEFEKLGDYSDDDFSDDVCQIIKKFSLPIETGHSSSPLIWQKSEKLNRDISVM